MEQLKPALERMARRIAGVLQDDEPSIYVYGSVTLGDFRLGWSDIDLLVLTRTEITAAQARQLVTLRQAVQQERPEDPYIRAFEGGMRTWRSFLTGAPDRVVYWGTSGERVTDHYIFDNFGRCQLLDTGWLLAGPDWRGEIVRPDGCALRRDVQRHYETIRQYAREPGRSLYAFGWLLDISRCLYTLRTGAILAKTAAGEWALREGLCPCRAALEQALTVRREPLCYRDDPAVLDAAAALGGAIQRYADVLEQALAATGGY